MILVLLPVIPLCAALLCLVAKSRVDWERLNLAAFALVAAFCGILKQLTRILAGTPREAHAPELAPWGGTGAMGLLLGALLFFSVWLPAPLLLLIHRAAGIIEGKP